MAYIGVSPVVGEFRKLDDISSQFNNSTSTFNLTVGGTASAAGSAQNLIISIDGVIQEPQTSYTVGGSTLQFSEAPNTASTFFGIQLGSVAQIGVPSDNSVTTSKIASNVSIQFAAGSVSAPALSPTGDTNTGIFFPAADTIAFAEGGAEAMRINASGNVGIGTSSPDLKLTVVGGFNLRNSTRTGAFEIDSSGDLLMGTSTTVGDIIFETGHNSDGLPSTGTERARITGDGYLRMASGSGGIQFNGDTAAANALDDYEEGTFTPIFDAADATGITYTRRLGRYTKIGNKVFVELVIDLSNKGSGGSGNIQIGGLPFTILNNADYFVNFGGLVDMLNSDSRQVTFQTSPNNNYLLVVQDGGSTPTHTSIAWSDVTNTTVFRVGFFYSV